MPAAPEPQGHRAPHTAHASTAFAQVPLLLLQMRIANLGLNTSQEHERTRLEIYALNTVLAASEAAQLQLLIQQNAGGDQDLAQSSLSPAELQAMLADSDDDVSGHSSPAKSGSPRKGSWAAAKAAAAIHAA